MSEKEQLIELNKQMINCINAVERIEIALLGDKFNDEGVIKRLNTMENKLKQLDKYMWMLVGMLSLGTIPIGVKILPYLKEYLK